MGLSSKCLWLHAHCQLVVDMRRWYHSTPQARMQTSHVLACLLAVNAEYDFTLMKPEATCSCIFK